MLQVSSDENDSSVTDQLTHILAFLDSQEHDEDNTDDVTQMSD